MFEKFKRVNALIGLSHNSTATAEICNAGAEKQNKICKELTKQLDVIEKKYPVRCYFRKDWRILWHKFCDALDRSGYYCEIAGRTLKETQEYLDKAEVLKNAV